MNQSREKTDVQIAIENLVVTLECNLNTVKHEIERHQSNLADLVHRRVRLQKELDQARRDLQRLL